MRTLTPSWNGKGEFDTRTVSSRNTKPESVNHCPRRSLRRIERRIEVIVRPVRRKRELGQYEDFAQLLSESADDTSRDCDGGDFNLEVVRLSRSSKTSHRMQFRGSGVAGGSDILAFGRTIEDFGDTNSDEGDCSSGTSASDLSHFDVDKSLPPTPVTIEFEADDVTSLEDGSSQISEPGRPVSQIPAMLLLDEVDSEYESDQEHLNAVILRKKIIRLKKLSIPDIARWTTNANLKLVARAYVASPCLQR